MEVKDGRGEYSKYIAIKNRNVIKAFFRKNPNATILECTKETGFAYRTIKRHILAIQTGDK